MGMVFSMIGSIFLAVVAAFVAAIAIRTTADGDNSDDGFIAGFGRHGWNGLWLSIAVGLFLGVINFVTPLLPAGAAWVSLILMLLFSVGLCLFWHRPDWGGVTRVREAIPCVILALLALLVTSTAASRAAGVAPVGSGGYALINALPLAAFIGTIGFFIADRLFDEGSVRSHSGFSAAGKAVSVVAALAVITALASPALGSGFGPKTATAEETAAIETLTVQQLTPEQLERITQEKFQGVSQVMLESSLSSHDRARVEATGFSDALTYGFSSQDEAVMFAELEEEILRNPVYAVTVAEAIMDKEIGGQTIGSFNPWMAEFVRLTDEHGISYWCEYRNGDESTMFVTNQYRIYAGTLCVFLERLIPQGVYAWQTTENWCLNSASLNNDRRGIRAPYQYTQDAFILAYVGKDQALSGNGATPGTGLFVIGFNVHDKRIEFYGGTPKVPNPGNPGTPSNPGDPDKPDKPDKPDEPKKDPSQLTSTNTEPNDNTGPGESTIDPSDTNHSSADRPDNSTSGSSSDYREQMNDLADTAHQQTGGGSNNPTTSTPSGTNVDNNGANGTGHGGADTPTPTSDPAREASTGENINSSPGGAWGGPRD